MARSRMTASRLEHFQPAFSSRCTAVLVRAASLGVGQVDKATAVAAELSLKDGGMSAKFGTSYKLSEGTTLKTKV